MKFKYLLFLLALLIPSAIRAQLSEVQTQKIDSLFVEWNKPNQPGGAIGIMQKGKIMYSKAFGLASLEYNVPNTIGTIFNTGSVSKQFTAMGIVLLHQQGKLSFDDDIRKYLPDLPDFGNTITIRHMLHHTSGMRSLHAMLGLAGWRDDDSRTNEDLYRFMLNQQELNFKPGEEYLYCNTGYMLMVNIIEKLTEQKFPVWMNDNIFTPLGMVDTYVEDNYMRIVSNNATSYYGSNSKFQRAVEFWGYIGSGNMHSTVKDLLIWLNNFSEPSPNWEQAFKMLQITDNLNDGSINNYAFGVTVDEVKGHKRVQHGGAIGGFRSFISNYPEEELSIAILTNFSSSGSGQKEALIADVLLKEDTKEMISEENTKEDVPIIQLSNEQLNYFEASYWNDKENYARKIYVKNDTLRYSRSINNESLLVPISNNEFKMLGVPVDLKAKFEEDKNGNKTMMVSINNGSPALFHSFETIKEENQDITTYIGSFYSPELETTYQVLIKDQKLMVHHSRHGDFPIQMLKKDILQIPDYAIIKYERGVDDKVKGIRISNGRARNVWFEKIK